ncbi:MAG TPA: hypothetical protein VE994_12880 [Terriglobales bacterium]|nr:hypothetical protein [Terriglobales bacterium]
MHSLYYSIPLFVASLALVVGGSVLLSRSMSRLGEHWNIPEQFLGFLMALGADSPEISSAVVAMLSGQTATGVGVVFGSNLFNLASLLGLAAIVGGGISVRRESVLLEGGVGVLVLALASALALQQLGAQVALALVLLIMLPYAIVLMLPPERLQKITLPTTWIRFLLSAATESHEHGKQVQATEREEQEKRDRERLLQGKVPKPERPKKLLLWLFGTLVVIILGSVGLVRSTTWLTSGWLPEDLLGTLVLAGLTGIPNLYTAARLARRHRGAAVFTEAMNSNSLNIVVGLMIPSLLFGSIAPHKTGGYLDIVWLLAMTGVVVALFAVNQGMKKILGMLVIAAYLAFVAVRVYLSLSASG